MDDKTRKEIESRQPTVIVHWDKDGNVTSKESYNLENISVSQWQMDQLAKTILDACKRFYADPENVKKYEKWKAKRDRKSKNK